MDIILIIIEILLLFGLTAGLVHYYAFPQTSILMRVVSFLAYFLGFLGILLLPIDIAHVQNDGSPSMPVFWSWQFVYLATFVMGYVVCPLCSDFNVAGDFTTGAKICTAIKKNFKLLLAAILLTAVVMTYLLVWHRNQLDNFIWFGMAAVNTYGLMLVLLFLGQGLVEVPRKLFLSSNCKKALDRLYFRASELDTQVFESMCDLQRAETKANKLVEALKQQGTRMSSAQVESFETFAEIIQNTIRDFPLEIEPFFIRDEFSTQVPTWEDLKKPIFIETHAELRQAQGSYLTRKAQWEELVRRAELLEAALRRERESSRDKSGTFIRDGFHSKLLRLKDNLQWIWLTKLRTGWLRVMAVLATIMSLVIFWSYVVLAVGVDNASPLGLLLAEMPGDFEFAVQLAALVPMMYMSLCIYRTLFTLKIYGDLSLQGPHLSPVGALLFNAQQMIRLQFSLGYSFILMAKYNRITALQLLMNNMVVVPIFGKDFNHYAPVLMVVLCLFTLFKCYARLLKLLGIETEDSANMGNPASADEIMKGRKLVHRYQQSRDGTEERPSNSASGGTPKQSLTRSVNSFVTFDTTMIELTEHKDTVQLV